MHTAFPKLANAYVSYRRRLRKGRRSPSPTNLPLLLPQPPQARLQPRPELLRPRLPNVPLRWIHAPRCNCGTALYPRCLDFGIEGESEYLYT